MNKFVSHEINKFVSHEIKACILPAAGRASRWTPLSDYLPKEMLPLVNRPVIEWVIDEIVDSGCSEIYVVVTHSKRIIRDYLSRNQKLNKKVKINYIYNDQSRGMAHSIYVCQDYIGNHPYAVAIPDVPTISRTPILGQLIKAYDSVGGNTHLLSFCNFTKDSLHLYSECLLKPRGGKIFEIEHFCPPSSDPTKPHHPESRLRMSGRYIFLPQSFQTIAQLLKTTRGTEIKDDHLIQEEYRKGTPVFAVKVEGKTYNTGAPAGYVRANAAFFNEGRQRDNEYGY